MEKSGERTESALVKWLLGDICSAELANLNEFCPTYEEEYSVNQ